MQGGFNFFFPKAPLLQVTWPAKKDKATQEYNFAEVLAKSQAHSCQVPQSCMPATDAGGAWKAGQFPPFNPWGSSHFLHKVLIHGRSQERSVKDTHLSLKPEQHKCGSRWSWPAPSCHHHIRQVSDIPSQVRGSKALP